MKTLTVLYFTLPLYLYWHKTPFTSVRETRSINHKRMLISDGWTIGYLAAGGISLFFIQEQEARVFHQMNLA